MPGKSAFQSEIWHVFWFFVDEKAPTDTNISVVAAIDHLTQIMMNSMERQTELLEEQTKLLEKLVYILFQKFVLA